MLKKNHTFHLVEISPWPILGAFSTMNMLTGVIKWFHIFNMNLFMISTISTLMVMFQWWRDSSREGTLQGLHTFTVVNGLRLGMILFIISEILFFMSFFWSFFHSSLSPTIEIGMMWPPKSIIPFNPLQIPLLNTIILISSGITVTWAHHSLMENNFKQSIYSLFLTISLGIYFSFLQGYEYMESSFSIADSTYGSTFFMATGFHGIHVIIGTSFLSVCLIRQMFNHFSSKHHFGFEAAAWYWHFVDVVWLFLYISIYWWGS
uniref:cytochrome c oxidase subunit III n=1 Tax=Curtos fulvocapitalis TaxID=1753970 RepID=UPI001D016A5B|nr:cytochrome c oxidase subunit III [Curtos fulvocapitalis]QVG61304.1 cytochrome c oxidase subunit 3 [Curtos fulvocapitalis]